MQAIAQLHIQLQQINNQLEEYQNHVLQQEQRIHEIEIEIVQEKDIITQANHDIEMLSEQLLKEEQILLDLQHQNKMKWMERDLLVILNNALENCIDKLYPNFAEESNRLVQKAITITKETSDLIHHDDHRRVYIHQEMKSIRSTLKLSNIKELSPFQTHEMKKELILEMEKLNKDIEESKQQVVTIQHAIRGARSTSFNVSNNISNPPSSYYNNTNNNHRPYHQNSESIYQPPVSTIVYSEELISRVTNSIMVQSSTIPSSSHSNNSNNNSRPWFKTLKKRNRDEDEDHDEINLIYNMNQPGAF